MLHSISRIASLIALTLLLAPPPVPADDVSESARDVSPDPAIVFSAFSFRGNAEILVSSGRAGMRETDNRGNHWRRSMSGLVDAATGIEPLASAQCQAPSARSTMYVLSTAANNPLLVDRPYRSDDFGTTWRPLAALPGAFGCDVDPLDPDVLYVGGFNPISGFTVLFKSTDGGQHFSSVGDGLQQIDGPNGVFVSPHNRNTIYVPDSGTFQGLYVSTDGGLHFARSPSAPAYPFAIAIHPTEPGTLFLATFNGLFRSTDGGATFTQPTGLSPLAAGVAFDPRDAQTNYVPAGTDGLFRTLDGGASYSRLPGPTADQLGHFGVVNVGIPPKGTPIYVSTSYGPLRSDDDGQTFVPNQRDYHGAAVNDLGFDATGRLLVGTFHTLQLFRGAQPGHPEPYQSPGATIVPGGETVAIAASPANANVLLVALVVNLGVFRTDNGGATWTSVSGIPFTSSADRMTFAPSDASRAYYVDTAGGPVTGFYRSTDEGRSFTQTFSEGLGSVVVDPSDANTVYVGTFFDGNGLFKSTDGGLTFTRLPLTAAQAGDFGSLAIDPIRPQTVYAGRRQGGVLRSDDGGPTWAFVSELPGGEVLGVALDPQHPAHVFAWIQGAGLFRSDDRGGTWRAADTGEAKRRSGIEAGRGTLVADPKVSGRVYIGNAGVVQIDTDEELVVNDFASSWTQQASGVQAALNRVIWTGTQFVVVGYSGTILTSPDGTTWTSQSSGTSAVLTGVAWSGSRLVAVGYGTTAAVVTSTDGVNWSPVSALPVSLTTQLYAIAWSGTQFVAVGVDASALSNAVIVRSADGLNWTSASVPSPLLQAVIWDGSQFVAAGGDFFGPVVLRSSDGQTWTRDAIGVVATGSLRELASAGTVGKPTIVAVGPFYPSNFTPEVLTSVAGGTWQPVKAMGTYADAVGWSGRHFLVCGVGVCAFSTDGLSWTNASGTLPSPAAVSSLVWGGPGSGRWVVVGTTNVIATSP